MNTSSPGPDYFQNKLLVAWFAHHMSMDQRRRLMAELPDAYNAMVGSRVVVVKLESSGEVL